MEKSSLEVISIDWDDGSGDQLTISFMGTSGNSECYISSDPNYTGVSRNKTLVFRTTAVGVSDGNQSEAYLGLAQKADSSMVILIDSDGKILRDKDSKTLLGFTQSV